MVNTGIEEKTIMRVGHMWQWPLPGCGVRGRIKLQGHF